METDAISLTVFFQEPFWIGVFERVEDGRLSACKVTFSAEEKKRFCRMNPAPRSRSESRRRLFLNSPVVIRGCGQKSTSVS